MHIGNSILLRAEAIAGDGKYEDIVERLRESGALDSCIERMKGAYGKRLALGDFVMTDRDWEMCAVLGLYDKDTLEHGIRTFELAYWIITHPFAESSSGEPIVIEDCLLETDVSVEQFLRSALFHDIGKIIIPREVLHNTLDDEEVLVKMFPGENIAEKEEHDKKAILQTLYANGIRPIDVVPLREIFSGEKYKKLLSALEERGFHETATLKDVIRMHEPESRRILTSLGYPTEGDLAGIHHNYENEIHRHRIHISGIVCGVADIIRIADVTDALQLARWYKKPLSKIEVLFVLVKDAEVGKINPQLAYLWIHDQYTELCAQNSERSLAPDGEMVEEETRAIETFLEKERQEVFV